MLRASFYHNFKKRKKSGRIHICIYVYTHILYITYLYVCMCIYVFIFMYTHILKRVNDLKISKLHKIIIKIDSCGANCSLEMFGELTYWPKSDL